MAVGALVLVLGVAIVLIAPMYLTTEFYKVELQSIQLAGSNFNSSSIVSSYTNIGNQAMEIAIAGAVLGAAGAAALVYGIATKADDKTEKPAPMDVA